MKLRVYLAGPMDGQDEETIHGWREEIKSRVHNTVECVDPSSLPFSKDFPSGDEAWDIVQADLALIDSSHMVCAMCDLSTAGTAQEVLYSFMNQLPVLIINTNGKLSPFTRTFSDQVVGSIDEAVTIINDMGSVADYVDYLNTLVQEKCGILPFNKSFLYETVAISRDAHGISKQFKNKETEDVE